MIVVQLTPHAQCCFHGQAGTRNGRMICLICLPNQRGVLQPNSATAAAILASQPPRFNCLQIPCLPNMAPAVFLKMIAVLATSALQAQV